MKKKNFSFPILIFNLKEENQRLNSSKNEVYIENLETISEGYKWNHERKEILKGIFLQYQNYKINLEYFVNKIEQYFLLREEIKICGE